jgi:hypothetical protein
MEINLVNLQQCDRDRIVITLKRNTCKERVRKCELIFQKLIRDIRNNNRVVIKKDLSQLNNAQLEEYYFYLKYKIQTLFQRYNVKYIIDHSFYYPWSNCTLTLRKIQ